jgi:hypothetical protein
MCKTGRRRAIERRGMHGPGTGRLGTVMEVVGHADAGLTVTIALIAVVLAVYRGCGASVPESWAVALQGRRLAKHLKPLGGAMRILFDRLIYEELHYAPTRHAVPDQPTRRLLQDQDEKTQ